MLSSKIIWRYFTNHNDKWNDNFRDHPIWPAVANFRVKFGIASSSSQHSIQLWRDARHKERPNLPIFVYCKNYSSCGNFKLKLCTCAQSHALGTRTKIQLAWAWNFHHKYDMWYCIFSREHFGELAKCARISETTPGASRFWATVVRGLSMSLINSPSVPRYAKWGSD